MLIFIAGAVFLTMAAVVLVVLPLFRGGAQTRAPVAALAAALVIPAAVILLYALVSNYPWTNRPAEPTTGPDTAAISRLRELAAASPDDPAPWVSLGDALVAAERFADAREAFRKAIRASGGNDAMRLSYAEAAILADRDALAGDAGLIVEDVLTRNPFEPKALWYGGMAALARGDTAAARERWRKLLDLSPPERVRQIIEQQLAALDAPVATPRGPAAGASASQVRIPVRVSIDAALAQRVRPGAPLFVVAREPGGAGGPPLAVIRRDSPSLPLQLEISDADSMIPGRTMSGRETVVLTARIANGGDAIAASGDVYGETPVRIADLGAGPVELHLDRVVE